MDQGSIETTATTGRRGLVMVHTGDGKGKTTAALGVVLRAWGQEMCPCVIQFIKSETGRWGEVCAAEKLAIDWFTLGDGFTWRATDLDQSATLAQQAWQLAQEKIAGGAYDLVVLDEFTYPLQFGWLDPLAVIDWLHHHRPANVHVVVTGRGAPPELVEFADLVTEMRSVKHPYQQGISAQRGIEF